LLQDHLGLFVAALAKAMVSNPALVVDGVQGRPVVVVEGAPDPVVVVDRDRVVDTQVLDLSADVVEVVLDVELRGVHADHDQPLILVLLGPGADIGKGAKPVDAGVGPELRTTFPRSPATVSGGELSHPVALSREGNEPSTGNWTAAGCVVTRKS
jgi:hypothetical protein